MDVKSYLEEGAALENFSSPAPWHTAGRLMDLRTISMVPEADALFIADARQRLPRYRKALEAVLHLMPWLTDGYFVVCADDVFEAIKKALLD